jgi:hypothetical protein
LEVGHVVGSAVAIVKLRGARAGSSHGDIEAEGLLGGEEEEFLSLLTQGFFDEELFDEPVQARVIAATKRLPTVMAGGITDEEEEEEFILMLLQGQFDDVLYSEAA